MMYLSQQKFIVGKDLIIKALDTTSYTNVNAVVLSPLPTSIKSSTNGIDNIIQILNNGVNIPEISDLNIDAPASIGSFCCGSNQSILFIVSKDTVNTLEQAKTSFNNVEVYAEFREDLKIDPAMYDLTIIDSIGNKLFNSNPIGLTQVQATIDSWSKTVDIQEIGIPQYIIKNITI